MPLAFCAAAFRSYSMDDISAAVSPHVAKLRCACAAEPVRSSRERERETRRAGVFAVRARFRVSVPTRRDGRACATRTLERVNAPVFRLSRMRRCRCSVAGSESAATEAAGRTPPNAETELLFSCPRYSLTDYGGRLIGDGREFVVQPQLPPFSFFFFFFLLEFLLFPLDEAKWRIDEFLLSSSSGVHMHLLRTRVLREFLKKSVSRETHKY